MAQNVLRWREALLVALSLVFTVSLGPAMSQASEQTLAALRNTLDVDVPISEIALETPCTADVQIIKQEIGRCIKLGRNFRGCLIGNNLHPFHPQCF